MTAALHIYPGFEAPALCLARHLGVQTRAVDIHVFPDGESKVTVATDDDTAIIYASLDHPNEKLVPLMLAAGALRQGGVKRLVLVCPYLCYMRQDKAFTPGEAISQQIIGPWLASGFDRIVTVDPHLHRVSSLAEVFVDTEADALTAASLIGRAVADDPATGNAVLVGPDAESRQWVSLAARQAGLDYLVAEKVRHGDRKVDISLPGADAVRGRPAVIVDDLISSGATAMKCAELLYAAGADSVEAVATHVLARVDDLAALQKTGVVRVRSTDSILHESNAISLAPLLAEALEREV